MPSLSLFAQEEEEEEECPRHNCCPLRSDQLLLPSETSARSAGNGGGEGLTSLSSSSSSSTSRRVPRPKPRLRSAALWAKEEEDGLDKGERGGGRKDKASGGGVAEAAGNMNPSIGSVVLTRVPLSKKYVKRPALISVLRMGDRGGAVVPPPTPAADKGKKEEADAEDEEDADNGLRVTGLRSRPSRIASATDMLKYHPAGTAHRSQGTFAVGIIGTICSSAASSNEK